MKTLKQRYKNEQFKPTALGVLVNPFYFARKSLYQHISEIGKKLDGKLLDIGCGTKPYQDVINATEYIGLEIDTAINRKVVTADYFYDGVTMPFEDKTFDSIMTNQVLEHVFNPSEFLTEMNRVVKIGGQVLLTVPFSWDEHEQPYDYARYSSFGLTHLLKEHGFEVIELHKANNGIEAIFQLINAYIYKSVSLKNNYARLALTTLLTAPNNILGLTLSKVLPRNDDFYLDNIVLAKKVADV